MRKVIWSKHEYFPSEIGGRVALKLTEQGEAVFHQFGVDYQEFESGAGNFSTAIIELPDGTVKNIPVENIKFIGQ